MENKLIKMESVYELVQDNFFLVLLGKIENIFESQEAKISIQEIISHFSPVFIHEMYSYLNGEKIIDGKDFFKSDELKKSVSKYRMRATKQRINESDFISKISTDMGISFDKDIYDINVVVNDKCVKKINFSEFDIRENNTFFSNCYATNIDIARELIKMVLKIDENEYEKILDCIIEDLTNETNDFEKMLSGERYSYKSSKLFKNTNIKDIDKYFIMHNYNVLQLLLVLKIFFSDKNVKICNQSNLNIQTQKCIDKLCAVEIELIGNQIKDINTDFTNHLSNKIDEIVLNKNVDFFKLNRKIRNNIHYSKIEKIEEELYENISNIQEVYIRQVLETFENELFFELDEEDTNINNFFQYCIENDIDKEEIDNNYEDYYVQFYNKKYIIRKIK